MFGAATSTQGRVGFRVWFEIARPRPDIIAEFGSYGSSLLADGMNRFGSMNGGIRPIKPGWKLAGPATTIKVRAADNLMIMRGIDIAQPGDVLVIATGRHHGNAVWGELMTLAALKRGLAGVVTDGAVRDVALLSGMGLPVFAAAVTPSACDKEGPGEINFPVAVGDVVVMPGDIVVADDDGVVAVTPSDRDDVVSAIRIKQNAEDKRRRDIEAGIVVPSAVVASVQAKLQV